MYCLWWRPYGLAGMALCAWCVADGPVCVPPACPRLGLPPHASLTALLAWPCLWPAAACLVALLMWPTAYGIVGLVVCVWPCSSGPASMALCGWPCVYGLTRYGPACGWQQHACWPCPPPSATLRLWPLPCGLARMALPPDGFRTPYGPAPYGLACVTLCMWPCSYAPCPAGPAWMALLAWPCVRPASACRMSLPGMSCAHGIALMALIC